MRRCYWILYGREAIRKHQHTCIDCQRWRAQPITPKMADLPPARLRLHKPAFHSCGMDCFGPLLVKKQLARQKIQFHFNPPSAPHFGGVWEQEVRSVKSALYTTFGTQSVPEEVLLTVLLEVEAILNSKPLGYISADIADPDPVTPSSLLMERLDGSLPQAVYPETELLSRRRWKHSQGLADQFWSRFIRDYLPSLQNRQKWQSSPADLMERAVVMIVDPKTPRVLWPIGHMIKTHHSADGHV
ncbi:hypothetical protein LDENG_00039950 [Lucifuga dentata]|nr:hypothetical protein LDENG_00039950 [Lucifuga dentata]